MEISLDQPYFAEDWSSRSTGYLANPKRQGRRVPAQLFNRVARVASCHFWQTGVSSGAASERKPHDSTYDHVVASRIDDVPKGRCYIVCGQAVLDLSRPPRRPVKQMQGRRPPVASTPQGDRRLNGHPLQRSVSRSSQNIRSVVCLLSFISANLLPQCWDSGTQGWWTDFSVSGSTLQTPPTPQVLFG